MSSNIDKNNKDSVALRLAKIAQKNPKWVQHDARPEAYAIRVVCVQCGRIKKLAHMLADTEGRVFVDYYCAVCARRQ